MNTASDNEDMDETYPKSSHNLKQSNSFGNLTDSSRNIGHDFSIDSTMKRNKSFWRFSKSEDILEGMALWKHRDLVPIDGESIDNKETTLKKKEKQVHKIETLQKKKSVTSKKMDKTVDNDKRGKDYRSKSKKDFKGNFEDEIYDESPKKRNDVGPNLKSQSTKAKYDKNQLDYSDKYSREIQDTNFYDDEMMVVKTVKRKEILQNIKQYYSSGTDTELSSSDPYDCIIVDDHLVPSTSTFRNRNSYAAPETDKRGSMYSRNSKHEISGTLLPRTKLSKSSRNEEFDMGSRMNTAKSNKVSNKNNNFGPWSNLWPDEKSFN